MKLDIARLFGVVVLGASIVSACGGDDASSDGSAGAAEAPVETTLTTEAAAPKSAPTTAADPRADWPKKLVFAAVPSEQGKQLQESYKVTLAVLEKELGVDIEFQQAADYSGVIEAQISGKVDVAQYGPFSYVLAKNGGAEIEPLGAIQNAKGVPAGYRSYGITQVDNASINSLADFAGKSVCFVDPGSTSGFLYPSAGLLAEKIDPATGVKGTFSGGHDAAALAVANGDCEAGFAFDTMVTDRLIKKGDLKSVVDKVENKDNIGAGEAPGVKIVWKSEMIAASPMTVLTKHPESFREALAEVVTTKLNVDYAVANGYCATAETCLLSDEKTFGYTAVTDSLYDGVRKVCELTKSTKCQ